MASKVAAVIGISEYLSAPLNNPVHDARDVSSVLRDIGFNFVSSKDGNDWHENCTAGQITNVLAALEEQARNARIAVFFFAGHGLEIEGVNYVIPIDVELQSVAHIKQGGIPLNKISHALRPAKFRLSILDACRDNPFPDKQRSVGLANITMTEPDRTDLMQEAVAYGAEHGTTASDGSKSDGNSPFSKALIKFLPERLEVSSLFREVRKDVHKRTKGKQRPLLYEGLVEDIYLVDLPDSRRSENLPHGVGEKLILSGLDISRGQNGFKPGAGKTEWLTDHSNAPEMVLVPEGKFVRGVPDSHNRQMGEVVISTPFLVSRFPITVGQWSRAQQNDWQKLTGLPPLEIPNDNESCPATHIPWNYARAYGTWLSKVTGCTYRLPSESEWEYACRAGSETLYWWGDTPSNKRAYYGVTKPGTNPAVAEKYEPNAWGLYQMSGNVWEWVADSWQRDLEQSPSDGTAYESQEVEARVLKGGGRFSTESELASGARKEGAPEQRFSDRGFRVVCELQGRPQTTE